MNDGVVGRLKPMKAGSPFSFLVPDDGGPEVYVRLSQIGYSCIEDVYGCQLAVKVASSDKGLMAVELLYVVGSPTPLPALREPSRTVNPATRPQRFDTRFSDSPGRALQDWANINLQDHIATFTNDAGEPQSKEYKSCLPELAGMLLRGEEWDFANDKTSGNHKILANYIRYTFYRLQKEDKIGISDDSRLAVINTGLVDNLFEPIYGVFQASKIGSKRPFIFQGFCSAGRGPLGKRILAPFERLPDRAEYFSSIHDVILPRDIEVVEQWEHIIDDGVFRGRYPVKFLRKYLPDDMGESDLAPNGKLEESVMRTFMNKIHDTHLYREFKDKIESCIKTALKRVEWNYKTAIPIYYPRRNKMSIALPLALFDSETADLALILEKRNNRTYYASTVLTLDQAYLSARLVCRPLSDWLTTNIQTLSSESEY